MIFINPWSSYHPNDIPDLNSYTNYETIAGICGFIIATIIHILLVYLCITLTKGILMPILVITDSAIIYPMLVICLIKLSFKIVDKMYKKKRK